MSAFKYRLLDAALSHRLIPDPILKLGSIRATGVRERREAEGGVEAQEDRLRALVQLKSTGPIAEVVEAANAQHYELPAEFLGLILGPRRKYSGCLWSDGVGTLAESEEAMLALTCARARIEDGQRILDLGCGWGSLSLWLAERYPGSEIVGVSNSHGQRRHIEAQAAERGFTNLTIITADVNEFAPEGKFDRVVSIEMFEHMRNWKELLRRISSWLEPDGKLFVHVFSHRSVPYLFESTWAAERFFTAGLMPSHDLMLRFDEDMRVADRWAVSGTHYSRTLDAWLDNLDRNRDEAKRILRDCGRSPAEVRRMIGVWRLFILSTREVWGYKGGDRWLVSHYLLTPHRN